MLAGDQNTDESTNMKQNAWHRTLNIKHKGPG